MYMERPACPAFKYINTYLENLDDHFAVGFHVYALKHFAIFSAAKLTYNLILSDVSKLLNVRVERVLLARHKNGKVDIKKIYEGGER